MTTFFNTMDNKKLTRAIWMAVAAVVLLLAAFGIYYYQDRYVGPSDTPPVQQSISQLEQGVRENPNDPQVRVALAEQYIINGQYIDAIEQSNIVLAAYPDNDAAMFILGVAYVRSGQTEQAIEPFENFAAIHREGDMPHADDYLEASLYFLGESYNKLGQPEEAIPVLEEAIAINFADADAIYQLGLAYTATGEHELALEQYHTAIRFVPDFTEVYEGMAESYSALGLVDHAQYAEGMVSFAEHDYVVAEEKLTPAAAALPEFAPVHLGLGLTYEQLGKFDLAIDELSLALELDPSDFTSSNALQRIEQTQSGQ